MNSLSFLNTIIDEAERLRRLSVQHREQSNFEGGLVAAHQSKFLGELLGHTREFSSPTSSPPR